MSELVISAMGDDRPGLVDELTQAAAKNGANVAGSRMVNLHGVFAIVMLVEIEGPIEPLKQAFEEAAGRLGLTLSIQQPGGGGRSGAAVPYRVRVYAMDQVGLVHRITHALHVLSVNIEELTTKLEHAPHTGAPLFSMDLIASVPAEVKLRSVRDNLEELCAELNCDLDIDRV